MKHRQKVGHAEVALQQRHTASFNLLPTGASSSDTPCVVKVEEEVLTALLTYSDGASFAHILLQHFPSIGHVLTADESRLGKLGLSRRDVDLLRLVHTTARLLATGAVRARPIVGSAQALLDYLQTSIGYEQVEQLRILFLDCRNHIIADEVLHRGTVNHTPVYPREVVKRALTLNASALIAVHNHPSGDPTPSREDIEMTRQLKSAAAALDLELHDHVVIGHGTHSSFRSLGLL